MAAAARRAPAARRARPARSTVYVGGSSSTISILALDLATGALTSRGTAPGGTSPTYLAWDGAQRFLYAGNGGQGRITAFASGPTAR